MNEDIIEPVTDNLEAAIDAVAEPKSRKAKTGAPAGEGTNQVIVRASETSHARWKDAAAKQGISMSEFIRNAADNAAAELLDCPHHVQQRRWYPWGEWCLSCGMQLRDNKTWLVDPDTIAHTRPYAANPAIVPGNGSGIRQGVARNPISRQGPQ